MVGRTERGKYLLLESKGRKNSPDINAIDPFVESHLIVSAFGDSVAQPVSHILLFLVM